MPDTVLIVHLCKTSSFTIWTIFDNVRHKAEFVNCILFLHFLITNKKFSFRPYYSQNKNPNAVAMFVIIVRHTSTWLCIVSKSGYSNIKEVWADDSLSLLPEYHSWKSWCRPVLLLELLLWICCAKTGNPVLSHRRGWLPDRSRNNYVIR